MNIGPSHASTQPQTTTKYQWYVVILLLCVSMFGYIDRLVLGLLIDPIKHDLQISDTRAGVLVGLAFTISYAVMGLPLGRLIDRFPRNLVLAAALLLWSTCTMLSGVAASFGLMFAARCGVGAGESAINPAALSTIGGLFPRERVSNAISVFAMGIYGGGGLAIILGGQLTSYLGGMGPIALFGTHIEVWRLVFLCVGLPGFLLTLLVATTVRDPRRMAALKGRVPEERSSLREALLHIRATRSLYPLLFLALGAFSFYTYAIQGWFPTMLSRAHHFKPHEIAIYYGVPYLICGIAGAVSAGSIVNFVRRRGHSDATVIIGLVTSILALVPALVGPVVESPTLCIVCGAAVIFLAALQQSTGFSILVLVTPPHMRGLITALYVLVLNVTSGAFGAILVGVMADQWFGAAHIGYGIALIGLFGIPLGAISFAIVRPIYRAAVTQSAVS